MSFFFQPSDDDAINLGRQYPVIARSFKAEAGLIALRQSYGFINSFIMISLVKTFWIPVENLMEKLRARFNRR